MSIVTLASGGLDSSLIAVLAKEEGITQFPLFIDYGQICKEQELKACLTIHKRLGLPIPEVMKLDGFGKLISSGLTNSKFRINEDAFLPGRNLLFLLAACAYAYEKNADAVTIGFLSEKFHIFPDQTSEFAEIAESTINLAMGRKIKILTPLINFTKHDVIELAKQKGIVNTYSCHAGTAEPCGVCVSCLERINASKQEV
jgi:7-cyano-7-deazaguanine synthase